MRLLYTSDLHGSIPLYHELLDLARATSAEFVALGGDLFPSFSSSRTYQDMIPNQKRFIDQFLIPFFERAIRTTRVDKIFLIPGNWDLGYPFLFEDPPKEIVDLDRNRHPLRNGFELIGYPFVPPTPFRPKDYERVDDPRAPWPPQKNPSYIRSPENPIELRPVDPSIYLRGRETIEEGLTRLPVPFDLRRAIYLMHSPPYGTRLDLIQGGGNAGSRSIRSFIEQKQPLVTLHGHIHEAPDLSGTYLERIGNTVSINPGQFLSRRGGSAGLCAVILELENPMETVRHALLGAPGTPLI